MLIHAQIYVAGDIADSDPKMRDFRSIFRFRWIFSSTFRLKLYFAGVVVCCLTGRIFGGKSDLIFFG